MRTKIIISLVAVIISSCIYSQEDPMFDRAKKSFNKKYSEAKDVEWSIDKNGFMEAGFKSKGEKFRADFKTDGTWVETERSIKWKELPDAIKEQVKKQYSKEDISELELVDHAIKGKFYDVEIKRKGKNHDIEFRESGKRVE